MSSTVISNKLIPYISAALSVTAWGLSFVATKVIMEYGHLSPTEAYIYRFILAWLIILLICHKRMWCNNWRDEFTMLVCGLCSGSLYFIAENTALELTLTANVSLLTSTSPLMTVFLVSFFYKSDKPGPGMILGSLVAMAGVTCVIFNSATGQIQVNPIGDLLSLAAALAWAFYSLLLRRLNAVYDAMFITRKVFFYGIITAVPFLLFEPRLVNPLCLFTNGKVLANLAFLVFGASILGFYLWSLAVKGIGAVKTNNFLYFQPIVTLVAAWIVFGEHIGLLGYLGTALILVGLWLSDFLQRRFIFKNPSGDDHLKQKDMHRDEHAG